MRRFLAVAAAVVIAFAYKAAGPWGATGACAGVLAVFYGGRRLLGWYLPDLACWWCKGTGTRWGSTRGRGGRSGHCFFCKGSGKRKSKSK